MLCETISTTTQPKGEQVTDIRKGDLIRATNKRHPGTTVEGRAASGPSQAGYVDLEDSIYFNIRDFDVEVLERAIDEELLVGAIEAYRRASGWLTGLDAAELRGGYGVGITAVIKFIREHDVKESK